MQFHWNGILLTTTTPGYHLAELNTRYRGAAYGEPWPLSDGEIDRWFTQRQAPELIPDIDFVQRHIKICLSHKTPVRVLLCATTSDWPLLGEAIAQRLLERGKCIGYDCWDGNERSVLHYDLHRLPYQSQKLEDMIGKLNEYGVLDQESDLEEFIEERDAVIKLHGWTPGDPRAFFEVFTYWPTLVYELPCPLDA